MAPSRALFIGIFLAFTGSAFAGETCYKLNGAVDGEGFSLPAKFCISEIKLELQERVITSVGYGGSCITTITHKLFAKYTLDGVAQETEVMVEDSTNEGKITIVSSSTTDNDGDSFSAFVEATLTSPAHGAPVTVGVQSIQARTEYYPEYGETGTDIQEYTYQQE